MPPNDNATPHSAAEYDEVVRRTIPYYDLLHEETLDLVETLRPEPRVWLDTGCGTGSLAKRILERFPDCRLILADPSEKMLAQAHARLADAPPERLTILPPIGSQDLRWDWIVRLSAFGEDKSPPAPLSERGESRDIPNPKWAPGSLQGNGTEHRVPPFGKGWTGGISKSSPVGVVVEAWPRPDVITAIQAHHYLRPDGRAQATRACYDLLQPGGLYVTCENIRPRTERGLAFGLERWRRFQVRAGRDMKTAGDHTQRFGRDYFPILLSEHFDLLARCGFVDVEMFWHSHLQAGFYAFKP